MKSFVVLLSLVSSLSVFAQEQLVKFDPSKYKWENCRYEKATMNRIEIPYSCDNGKTTQKKTVFGTNVICQTTVQGGRVMEVTFMGVCHLGPNGEPLSPEDCNKDDSITVDTIYKDAPLRVNIISPQVAAANQNAGTVHAGSQGTNHTATNGGQNATPALRKSR
jgi:hypothetical protein